jgi:D-3-phosphoglycerate dehydrogenase
MNVLGYDPQITVQRAWQLSSRVEQALSLDDLFARSDAISVHVPLNGQTRDLVNAARLKLMRSGGVLLNFARAPIVTEADVVAALDAGRLHAYVCDFPSNALKGHPRAVTLPHLGASTSEAEENCAVMAADQLRDYLEHGNIRNRELSWAITAAAWDLLARDRECERAEHRPDSTAQAEAKFNIASAQQVAR